MTIFPKFFPQPAKTPRLALDNDRKEATIEPRVASPKVRFRPTETQGEWLEAKSFG